MNSSPFIFTTRYINELFVILFEFFISANRAAFFASKPVHNTHFMENMFAFECSFFGIFRIIIHTNSTFLFIRWIWISSFRLLLLYLFFTTTISIPFPLLVYSKNSSVKLLILFVSFLINERDFLSIPQYTLFNVLLWS